jgi:hypothetical protein
MCHPTRAISQDFWDGVNFARGANPPRSEWNPAPRHDPALIPTMQANYRRLCDYLRHDPRLEIVGWGDLIRRFDRQRPDATHAELLEIADRIASELEVLFTDHFTAGEILLMLCRAAVAPQERYPRRFVYGPLTLPPTTRVGEWDAEEIRLAAPTVLDSAKSGYLPASVSVGSETIGLGTYFVALAQTLQGHAHVNGPADAPYPPAAEAIAREVARSLPHWIIHPENMDLRLLLEQTRLQCWTLKPAWPREALDR